MAFTNDNQPKRPKTKFADFCELTTIEPLSKDELSDYDKETGVKFLIVVKCTVSQRLGSKSYDEEAHFAAKVVSTEGMKIGDSVLVKGSHAEGKRWLSGATVRLIKK